MVSIKNQLIRVAAIGAVGVAAGAGFVAPASAAQAASARAGLAQVAVAALPNVNIQGSPPKWNPTTLTVAPKTYGKKCTAAKEVYTITNKTKKSAVITYKKGGKGKKLPFGTLPAGETGGICAEGSAGATFTLYIKGSKSVLTVTLS